MARRAVRREAGLHVPQLARGLRTDGARFADRIRVPVLDCLDRGEPFEVGGDKVWTALYLIDPALADQFRALCGYQRGSTSAWLAVENTRWTFDPRTSVLTRQETP